MFESPGRHLAAKFVKVQTRAKRANVNGDALLDAAKPSALQGRPSSSDSEPLNRKPAKFPRSRLLPGYARRLETRGLDTSFGPGTPNQMVGKSETYLEALEMLSKVRPRAIPHPRTRKHAHTHSSGRELECAAPPCPPLTPCTFFCGRAVPRALVLGVLAPGQTSKLPTSPESSDRSKSKQPAAVSRRRMRVCAGHALRVHGSHPAPAPTD